MVKSRLKADYEKKLLDAIKFSEDTKKFKDKDLNIAYSAISRRDYPQNYAPKQVNSYEQRDNYSKQAEQENIPDRKNRQERPLYPRDQPKYEYERQNENAYMYNY